MVPWIFTVSYLAYGDSEALLPRVVRYQLWSEGRFLVVGVGTLLVGALVSMLVLLTPWVPRGATWGEWVTGLCVEGSSRGGALVRWVGRLLLATTFALAVTLPMLRGQRAARVSSLLWGCVPLVALWIVARVIRLGLASWSRSPRGALVDDGLVFDRARTPERVVAWSLIGSVILRVIRFEMERRATFSDSVVPYFILDAIRAPLGVFGALATVGLLLAVRARAVREDRPFELSEVGLVVGFFIPPYLPVHAFRVASQFLAAFPEARERTARKLPPVAAFVVIAASGLASIGVDFVVFAASKSMDFLFMPLATERIVVLLSRVVSTGATAVVFLRLREVLAASSARPEMGAVVATFE